MKKILSVLAVLVMFTGLPQQISAQAKPKLEGTIVLVCDVQQTTLGFGQLEWRMSSMYAGSVGVTILNVVGPGGYDMTLVSRPTGVRRGTFLNITFRSMSTVHVIDLIGVVPSRGDRSLTFEQSLDNVDGFIVSKQRTNDPRTENQKKFSWRCDYPS